MAVKRTLSLVRYVEGGRFFPVRALPFVAPWTLRPGTVIKAAFDPDEKGGLGVFSVTGALGTLELRSPVEFGRYCADIDQLTEDAPFLDYVRHMPNGVVVRYEEAWRLHVATLEVIRSMGGDIIGDDTFDDRPALGADQWEIVFEGFPREFVQQRGRFRANSAARSGQVISGLCDELFRRAAASGMTIDKKCLPGTKQQLRSAVFALDQSMAKELPAIEDATMDDYLKKLGLRWPPGRPSEQEKDPWSPLVRK